jgi:hypothetical protein
METDRQDRTERHNKQTDVWTVLADEWTDRTGDS